MQSTHGAPGGGLGLAGVVVAEVGLVARETGVVADNCKAQGEHIVGAVLIW